MVQLLSWELPWGVYRKVIVIKILRVGVGVPFLAKFRVKCYMGTFWVRVTGVIVL